MRELIEVAQALEACIGEGQHGHLGIGKKRDGDYPSSKPPLSKKGKSRVFEQYWKRRPLTVSLHQQSSGRMMRGSRIQGQTLQQGPATTMVLTILLV